ncbi:MAG: hypothetical protein ABFD92_17760 [Planctomycetaceae bacterium]|nr:hypothetical protein [Planctomycetaceae bacterium]
MKASRYYVVATYRVGDFNQFKDEFDQAQDMLQSMGGFKKTYLNRGLDDPNLIVIVHECGSLQKARDFYDSQEFKQCLDKAGIVEKPQVSFVEELWRTPQLAMADARPE